MKLSLLCLGDVTGEAALSALCRALPTLRRQTGADLVLVNAENAADNCGTLPALCTCLFEAGADVLTGGNHTLKNPEMRDFLDNHPRALRPANLKGEQAGSGALLLDVADARVLFVNLMGNAFLAGAEDLFSSADALLARYAGKYDFAVCDLHAEATAEKGAFARDMDGVFSVVVGTHTHVPTADLRILPRGTGFVTDLGMCGAQESVLGVKIEESVRRFRTGEPLRYRPATESLVAQGALFFLEDGRCVGTERVFFPLD